ncbi:4662_t:CDS:1 [Ambispora gerdemannii]|uniref:4662_t:CDS:1 n=1 Tax=Ambispora gerdemannii TaxID=144530 RepID=A0A9N8ZRU5_9GLOM|nr:4662_t:CDS:1 [Ambispora gerdemannii]
MLETNVDAKPRKIFHHSKRRYVEILESNDMMEIHWNRHCSRPKTRARLIREAVRNDNMKREDKDKYLGVCPISKTIVRPSDQYGVIRHYYPFTQTIRYTAQWLNLKKEQLRKRIYLQSQFIVA